MPPPFILYASCQASCIKKETIRLNGLAGGSQESCSLGVEKRKNHGTSGSSNSTFAARWNPKELNMKARTRTNCHIGRSIIAEAARLKIGALGLKCTLIDSQIQDQKTFVQWKSEDNSFYASFCFSEEDDEMSVTGACGFADLSEAAIFRKTSIENLLNYVLPEMVEKFSDLKVVQE